MELKIFNNKYTIDNKGRIYSNKFKRYIKPCITNGYQRVSLLNKSYYVHRLVAIHFINNPENKPQINHKDGNKLNNDVSNLEWVNCSENLKHAYDTGLKIKQIGEMCKRSKLKDKDIIDILNLFKNGYGCRKIAKIYNVTRQTILSIKNGKTWTHITNLSPKSF